MALTLKSARFGALAAAGILVAANLFAPTATAAPNDIVVDTVPVWIAGHDAPVVVEGCDAPNSIVIDFVRNGAVVSSESFDGAADFETLVATPTVAGTYSLRATCLQYSGEASTTDESEISLIGQVTFNPTTWNAGDVVTITARGFNPNESVILGIVDQETEEELLVEEGEADANGVATFRLVLPAPGESGNFVVTLGFESTTLSVGAYGLLESGQIGELPLDGGDEGGSGGEPSLPDTGV